MFWSLLYWTNLGVGEWDALGSQNFEYLFAMVDIYLGMPDIPERTHGRNDSVPKRPTKTGQIKTPNFGRNDLDSHCTHADYAGEGVRQKEKKSSGGYY